MQGEVLQAGDACRLIRRIEELLEMPIVTVVCATGGKELSFLMPGESDKKYLKLALRWVAAAAQDASKSL